MIKEIPVGPLYNEENPCTVLSLAIAAEIGYAEAFKIAARAGRVRNGRIKTADVVAQFNKENLPVMAEEIPVDKLKLDGGRSVEKVVLSLPKGNFLVRSQGHVQAVVDRQVFDFEEDYLYPTVTNVWKIVKRRV